MAGRTPFFLTGANAKILLNNKTVAFATDISYKITVRHASPRVLGRYEVEVHEPLSYDVTGSFTIIRYARGLKEYLGGNTPNDVDPQGDGIGSFGSGSFGATVGSALGLPSADGQFDGKPNESFVPARMFQSKMFDIEIRQKVPDQPGGQTNPGFGGTLLTNFLGGTTPGNGETTIVLLRDCRIEEADFRMTKRGAATQTFQFKARYADDDTYIAAKSGVGQELS
jgi:hypothetical protein